VIMNIAVISVGSNIDPQVNIERARCLLAGEHELLGESSFVRTKPIGYLKQPDFLNGAFLISTELDQEELEKNLKEIEKALGRVKTAIKFGPRTIDLDIVVWNGNVISRDFYERDFVRNACCDLLPELAEKN
jgi:2-amino-4-hydroxy-6-hydroxymethyldihydropteridine diphosphokinase